MIILHRDYDEKKNGPIKRQYEVFESDENIIIKYFLIDQDRRGEVTLRKSDWQGKCADVWSTTDSSLRTISITRDLLKQDPFERIAFKEPHYFKIARIVFDQDNIYCHLQGQIEDIPGFENLVISENDFSSNVLEEKSQLFKQIKKRYKAKSDLLHGVSAFNSLSYLECQLDLVTRVLLQNKEFLQQTEELKLLEEYDQQSVTLIKENIESEIENKYKVREQQAKYYLNR